MIKNLLGTLFGVTTTLGVSALDDVFNDLDEMDQTVLMCLTTTTALMLMNNSNSTEVEKQVEDTQMIVESMSLEELYELRDLTLEKENSLKLHM